MSSKQALQPATETKSPTFVEIEKFFEHAKELTESIGRRAYEFFEARGREFGHDLEDWIRAETEVIRHIPVEILDKGETVLVRAEVPGFTANDIKISLDGRQLMMTGKVESTKEEKTEEKVYNERRSNQFARAIMLPTDIDGEKTTAELKDGVLELTLVKAPKPATINVEVKPTA